jgi:hypothetical protein
MNWTFPLPPPLHHLLQKIEYISGVCINYKPHYRLQNLLVRKKDPLSLLPKPSSQKAHAKSLSIDISQPWEFFHTPTLVFGHLSQGAHTWITQIVHTRTAFLPPGIHKFWIPKITWFPMPVAITFLWIFAQQLLHFARSWKTEKASPR